MNGFGRFVARLAVSACLLMTGAAASAQSADGYSDYRVICGKSCLGQFADRFLDALSSGDPSRVPLASNVRYTENGVELAIGDALWSTAEGLGEHRLVFTDPQSGGIQLYAGIVESGLPSMLAARLKVENRELTEIETSVLRRDANDPAMSDFAVDRPIWREQVQQERRVSRQALIDIADSYFEGITQARAGITPFDDGCVRYENGGRMTLADSNAGAVQQMSCEEQFAAGMLIIVTSISHRRYLVIDEENQVASAIVTFDHRGNLDAVPYGNPNDTVPRGDFSRPFSFLIFESFKIIDGRIRQVEATVFSVPYKMHPGWPAEQAEKTR